jgi:hypothetical protein
MKKNIGASLLFVAIGIFILGWMSSRLPVADAAASYNPRNGDPCALNLRVSVPVNLAASGQVIPGVAGKYTYLCHIFVITTGSQNVALVEGTGTTCATGIAGMSGGATAATGWILAANQLINEGNGAAQINATATAGDNICLLLSGTGQTSGSIQFVQQ